MVNQNGKILYMVFFFLIINTWSGFWPELGDPFVSQNIIEFMRFVLLDRFSFVQTLFVYMVKF